MLFVSAKCFASQPDGHIPIHAIILLSEIHSDNEFHGNANPSPSCDTGKRITVFLDCQYLFAEAVFNHFRQRIQRGLFV